jgi:hypothetical protein
MSQQVLLAQAAVLVLHQASQGHLSQEVVVVLVLVQTVLLGALVVVVLGRI